MNKTVSFFLLAFCFITLTALAQTNDKLERLRKKHEKWDSCFVVKVKGDTVYGKVSHRDDQSSVLGGFQSDVEIFFAHANTEKEELFIPNNIRELYIYNAEEGFHKYLTLEDRYYVSNYGMLYRIIEDGPCKLISIHASYVATNPTSTAKECFYYVYYKSKRTELKTLIYPNGLMEPIIINPLFRKKCKDIFSECPTLVARIEDKTYTSENLREIISEFNRCIAK